MIPFKFYDSFDNYKVDPSLIGQQVYAFKKYDGQNFVVKYSVKRAEFQLFGSRTQLIDESDPMFGKAIVLFKTVIANELAAKVKKEVKKKNSVFENTNEIEFYFEYVGEHSFCGSHDANDEIQLVLIDIFINKKGYIEPKKFCEFTEGMTIPVAELIYKGKLTKDFIHSIENNDWTAPNPEFPTVKEGVVCKKTTRDGTWLKKTKVKTFWWLNKLKERYPDEWEILE